MAKAKTKAKVAKKTAPKTFIDPKLALFAVIVVWVLVYVVFKYYFTALPLV
ncbi:hypothetical protein KKG52_00545 [Patescibacteria group bacterium]|nr:hypothetical protein [Patescibacteria group bacterium]